MEQNFKKINVSSDSLFPSTSRQERSSEFSFVPVWSRSYAILSFLYCQPTLTQYLSTKLSCVHVELPLFNMNPPLLLEKVISLGSSIVHDFLSFYSGLVHRCLALLIGMPRKHWARVMAVRESSKNCVTVGERLIKG